MTGGGLGVTVSGQDMFGAGAAVSGIADEASEVLNELDRPIIRRVITTVNKKTGKIERSEINISKLDIILGIAGYFVVKQIKEGTNPFEIGGIFDLFKNLFTGGWGGGVGAGLNALGSGFSGMFAPEMVYQSPTTVEGTINMYKYWDAVGILPDTLPADKKAYKEGYAAWLAGGKPEAPTEDDYNKKAKEMFLKDYKDLTPEEKAKVDSWFE